MTYVYDIVLNLTEYNYYDIYEWNNNDNYINIKKIPIFKVENNTLNNLINNKVKVTKDFLELINNKSIKNNNYSFISIFTNCEKSIGICFNSDGYIKYKSALMFNDEKTVNDIAKKEKIFKLKYRYFINKENNYLREDIVKIKYINKKINDMYKKKEYKKLRYIYYEIYNRKEDNKKIIYNSLVNLRNCNNIDYIYNLLKIKNIVIEK